MCLCFIMAFSFGPGAVVWIYMSEIMNETGVSIAMFVNWFLTSLVGLGSPWLTLKFGGRGNIFIMFAVF